jgi:hypothetical protein
MINKETEFYSIKIEDLTYFKLVSIKYKKNTGEKEDWDELFKMADDMFDKINFKYILIIDINKLSFPGLNIIKRFSYILKKYPDNIDNYLIESTIVIPTTILSKTLINILFKFYTSRRPIHTKYSYEEAREAIEKTITQFTKN